MFSAKYFYDCPYVDSINRVKSFAHGCLQVFKIVLKAKGDQIQNCMLCDWSILDPLSPEDLAPLWLFGYLHYLHYLIG